jgi:hypothetical protein
MLGVVGAWLKPFWLSIVKWGAVTLAVMAILFKVRQSGKDAVMVENLEKDLSNAKEIIREDNIVSSAPIDGMRERLDAALRRKRNS